MDTSLLVVSPAVSGRRYVDAFRIAGYSLADVASLAAAVRCILDGEFAAVVLLGLDHATPEHCAVLRALGDVPLIVAGVRLPVETAAACLDAGADAVIALPMVASEINAHIQAVLRRSQPRRLPVRSHVIAVGNLTIDLDTHTVRRDGKDVSLSPTEFNLLAALAEAPGTVVANHDLLIRVWGPEYADDVHYVRLYIGYLRNKLEPDPRRPSLIVNQWGVGYRLALPGHADLPPSPAHRPVQKAGSTRGMHRRRPRVDPATVPG